jgi:hypothetical protein
VGVAEEVVCVKKIGLTWNAILGPMHP